MSLKKILLLFAFYSFVSIQVFANLNSSLRPGDVILLPLKCSVCRYISDETFSKYTHVGLVIENDGEGHVRVVEAFGRVRVLSLEDFLTKLPKDQNAAVFRSHELNHLYEEDQDFFLHFEKNLRSDFFQDYIGRDYDPFYLWDNFGIDGEEIYYCSELVAKMLNKYIFSQIETSPMTFRKNWAYWYQYFRGSVPEGRPGVPPHYFASSKLFYPLGEIR